jgi:cyclase
MNRRDVLKLLAAATAGEFTCVSFAQAQGALSLEPLTDRLVLLSGAGGNITIVRSDDGVLMVDAGLPNTADAVAGKVKESASLPVQHLINTHWHQDHTGGNESFGKAGAHIMAHENCAKRLAAPQHMAFFNRDIPALPDSGQPKQTFKTKGHLAFGGQKVEYAYFPPAHTDGDITVHFTSANVYSTGDLFFCGMYPFIDYSSGGSIEGTIQNSAAMLKVVDSKTKIVPGHGPLGTKIDLQLFHDVIADANQRVSTLIQQGKTVDELIAAQPTRQYDAQWGNGL